MSFIAVLDTETNWDDEVMSIGIVKAEAESFVLKESKYFVIDPEYLRTGLYSAELFLRGQDKDVITDRKKALQQIKKWMKENEIGSIFAYNASFDKNHLPELLQYEWYDIMRIAAYRQYNNKIPKNVECCGTGRLKRNFGVEPIARMLSGNKMYCETHNALQDAIDELEIMKLLGLPVRVYENAAKL